MNRITETPTAQHVLDFLERVAAAEQPLAVLQITQDYLLAWPKERVVNLQRIDGGWAPYDREQNPLPLNTLGHLDHFHKVIHRQCLALSQANLQLTPELIELDEILSIASRFANAISAPEFKERPARGTKRSAILNLL